MDVDVHFLAIAIQEKERERVTGRRHQVMIGRRKRVQQQAIADEAAVDEQEDRIAVQLLNLRRGDKSAQCEDALRALIGFDHIEFALEDVQIDQLFERLSAEHLINSLAQGRDRSDIKQYAGAVPKLEGFLRMRQAIVRGERCDVGQLGLIGAQKFLACWDIVKEIAHGYGGARRAWVLIAAQQLAARDFDRGARGFLRRARFQQQARDTGNGRQSFAAEAQRRDGGQILDVAELAGGVALKSQKGVVSKHAAAVVGDANEMAAAAFDVDAQVSGAGIERIFEEFFNYGSWSLYHLAGRNFVRDRIGEDSNFAHDAGAVLRAHGG